MFSAARLRRIGNGIIMQKKLRLDDACAERTRIVNRAYIHVSDDARPSGVARVCPCGNICYGVSLRGVGFRDNRFE
jgi:hypothetical protein